ncbi:MAG: peptidylprolyl isomerase [Tannerella sp.]|nr:peptidylprolyl isomerase [Tannerella sp.]
MIRKNAKIWLLCLMIPLYINVQAQEAEVKVLIDTDKGKITVKLYNETPLHRDNFIKLVEAHHYDSLLFHRVIKQFMIQAGDINSKNAPPETKLGDGDLDYTLPAEIVYPRYFHKRGQLCAARQSDDINPERASSASQFYIVTGKFFTDNELNKMELERNIKLTPEQREAYMLEGGTPQLDDTYTVFGEVIKGMNVVDKIQFVPVDINDRPVKDLRIRSMKIVK